MFQEQDQLLAFSPKHSITTELFPLFFNTNHSQNSAHTMFHNRHDRQVFNSVYSKRPRNCSCAQNTDIQDEYAVQEAVTRTVLQVPCVQSINWSSRSHCILSSWLGYNTSTVITNTSVWWRMIFSDPWRKLFVKCFVRLALPQFVSCLWNITCSLTRLWFELDKNANNAE
jgi:hypothetical protein